MSTFNPDIETIERRAEYLGLRQGAQRKRRYAYDGRYRLRFRYRDNGNILNTVYGKIGDYHFGGGTILHDGRPLPQDKQTLGIAAFNDMIRDDRRVESVILPLRDGLNLIRKK